MSNIAIDHIDALNMQHVVKQRYFSIECVTFEFACISFNTNISISIHIVCKIVFFRLRAINLNKKDYFAIVYAQMVIKSSFRVTACEEHNWGVSWYAWRNLSSNS